MGAIKGDTRSLDYSTLSLEVSRCSIIMEGACVGREGRSHAIVSIIQRAQ